MKGKIDKPQGARIREARIATRIGTQEALGALLRPKVERAAVSLWERGGGITQANLREVARITGYAFEWLATGRGPKTAPVNDSVSSASRESTPESPENSGEVNPVGPHGRMALRCLNRISQEEAMEVIDRYLEGVREKPPENPRNRA
jgi:hypothetical protein